MGQSEQDFKVEHTPALGVSEIHNDTVKLDGWEAEKTVLLHTPHAENQSIWLYDVDHEDIIEISQLPCLVGRSPECHLQLDDPTLSRSHCQLLAEGGGFVVEDTGSANGTYVNGHRVERAILVDKDKVSFGTRRLVFYLQEPDLDEQIEENEYIEQAAAAPARKPIKTFVILGLICAFALSAGLFYQLKMRNVAVIPIANVPTTSKSIQRPDAIEATPPPTITQPAANVGFIEGKNQETSNMNGADPVVSEDPPPVMDQTAQRDIVEEPAAAKLSPEQEAVEPAPPVIPDSEVTAQIAPKPKPKPKAKVVSSVKPQPIRLASAQEKLEQARMTYLKGDAERALAELKDIERSTRYPSGIRSQSAALRSDIEALYSRYTNGKALLSQGDKDQAYAEWSQLLKSEALLFQYGKSVYALEVRDQVLEEYHLMGKQAQAQGDLHDAYNYWYRAAQISDTSKAANELNAIDSKAKQLFREGYRLETVNLEKAKQHWQEVVKMIPPGLEYHTRASAKLHWYDTWGQ